MYVIWVNKSNGDSGYLRRFEKFYRSGDTLYDEDDDEVAEIDDDEEMVYITQQERRVYVTERLVDAKRYPTRGAAEADMETMNGRYDIDYTEVIDAK